MTNSVATIATPAIAPAIAPDYVWNAYDTIRRRDAVKLAELHAQGINAPALKSWSSHDAVRQTTIQQALGL